MFDIKSIVFRQKQVNTENLSLFSRLWISTKNKHLPGTCLIHQPKHTKPVGRHTSCVRARSVNRRSRRPSEDDTVWTQSLSWDHVPLWHDMTLTPLHIHTVTPWHLNNHWYQCRNMQCRQWYQRDWWSSFTHALIGWLGTSLTWANYAAGRLARDETGCTHHHTPLAQGYATAWIWNTLYNVIVIYTLGHQGPPAYRVYNPIWLHVLPAI